MSSIDKLTELFHQLKAGDYSIKDELFETIWINFTRLAFNPKAQPMLAEIYQWTEENQKEHPDFYELSLISKGFILFLQDHFAEAEKILYQAKDLFTEKRDLDGIAATCVCIGFLHRSTGELDLALKNGLTAMEQLRKTTQYKMFRLLGCYWIGSVYAETGHLDEALSLFEEGKNLDYKQGLRGLDARLTSGIASVYMKQKKYDLALANFQQALDLSNVNTENTFRSRGLTDIADYYFEMGDYTRSIHYNQEALKLRRELKQQNASITNLINLGRIYLKQEKFDLAIEALNEAQKIGEEIQVKVKIYQIHQLYSEIYQQMGNITLSLDHFKKFHEIKEEVNHEDLERRVKNQVQLFQAQQIEKENVIIKAQKIEIENEKKRSEELLHNILPEEVAEELKSKGNADARLFDHVTVLFTDFKDFTGITENMTPQELVEEIHTCFKTFDEIIEKYGIEKIKTIGDSYMCAAGLPVINKTHAEDIVNAALEIRDFIETYKRQRKAEGKKPFEVRIGIHTGPVVAGIVGIRKFAYDIWGDTVNTASRMESSGEEGKVNISEATYELIKDKYECTPRGKVVAKHKGEMEMYFVEHKN
ncbi:MAG: tetratricopeptide repeat protein [Bacteroidetes bacterium]|nr:tetratricopeptide repeat protein [Bacteroidota bacterium]